MQEILKLNAISNSANSAFDGKFTMNDTAKKPVAVMVRSFDMHGYALPESVLCVGRAGAGVNNIPVSEYSNAGVPVFNTPGANANAVKEQAIFALLAASRGLAEGIEWTKTLTGDDVPSQVEKGKKAFVGREIYGKVLGVIGLGAIGVLVANAAKALGMRVMAYDPYLSVSHALSMDSDIKTVEDVNLIFKYADYISLHVPLNDATRGIINAKSLASCRNGLAVVNLARGELVNTADILEAINSGKVSRYVTDFPDKNLIGVKNVIAIPHLGASTAEAEDNCAAMAAQEVADFILNGNIVNSVNYPAIKSARTTDYRLVVLHKNVQKVISVISDFVARENINIENFYSQSKGEFAASLLDITHPISDKTLQALAAADNVLKVRLISCK